MSYSAHLKFDGWLLIESKYKFAQMLLDKFFVRLDRYCVQVGIKNQVWKKGY